MSKHWISTDPALGDYVPLAPINDEAKRHNRNMPGMGGVLNTVNMNLYHYAGNNPTGDEGVNEFSRGKSNFNNFFKSNTKNNVYLQQILIFEDK